MLTINSASQGLLANIIETFFEDIFRPQPKFWRMPIVVIRRMRPPVFLTVRLIMTKA